MSNIVIIDDDYAMELLAEHLQFCGHQVRRLGSAVEALSTLEDIVSSDLIILDIIMECPDTVMGKGISGGRATGMAIFREVRERNKNIPILAYSATQDKDVIDILSKGENSRFISKWSTPTMAYLANTVQIILGIEAAPVGPTVFIVHGHNDAIARELKNYLQNVVGLPEPIILHEQPNMGKTIIEKFEEYAFRSNLAFILLTPDDQIVVGNQTESELRRARQNVILEMGFFLGVLGRDTGRVILLYSGPLDLPSDLSGIIYIDISRGIEAAGEQIRKEIRHVFK